MFITVGDIWMSGQELDAQLIQIADDKIQVIRKFSEIYLSSDGTNHKTTGADVSVISYSPSSGAGEFPKSYFVKQYECTGSNGSINPKTCRAKKGVK